MAGKHSRKEILAAGIQLMRRDGYNAVGVDRILKEAGVPRGSFYNYFDSKEGFAIEAVHQYSRDVLVMLHRHGDDMSLEPWERIEALFREAQSEYVSTRFEYSCLMGNLAAELGAVSDDVADAVRNQLDLWKLNLAGIIREGIKKEGISNRLSAEQWAHWLLDQYFAAQIRMKVERRGDALELFFTSLRELLKQDRP